MSHFLVRAKAMRCYRALVRTHGHGSGGDPMFDCATRQPDSGGSDLYGEVKSNKQKHYSSNFSVRFAVRFGELIGLPDLRPPYYTFCRFYLIWWVAVRVDSAPVNSGY